MKCVALIATLIAGSAAADTPASVRLLWEDYGTLPQTFEANVSPDRVFAIASVGKTMTAVMVLSLVEDGVISLGDPAARWLGDDVVSGLGGLNGVTIEHLLVMESGLPDYYGDDYILDALDDPDAVQRADVAVSYIFGEQALFAPGTRFDYSNTNYVLLGLIAEQATGQSYGSLMQNRVLTPAGMNDSFVFGTRALPESFLTGHEGQRHIRNYYEGNGFGDGGILSSAPDLARFYKALFFTRSLISSQTLELMLRDPGRDQYGLGIAVDGDIVGHSGADLGFSSDVAANLATGTIAVMLSAQSGADMDWVLDQLYD